MGMGGYKHTLSALDGTLHTHNGLCRQMFRWAATDVANSPNTHKMHTEKLQYTGQNPQGTNFNCLNC